MNSRPRKFCENVNIGVIFAADLFPKAAAKRMNSNKKTQIGAENTVYRLYKKYEYYKYKSNDLKSSQNVVQFDENTKNFAPIHRSGVKNVLKVDFFLENC